MNEPGWRPVVSCVDVWDTSAALDYLADALAEHDAACLAYALAAIAAGAGIAFVAMPPLGPKENGPSGPFVGLPWPSRLGGFDQRDDVGSLPEFGL